jgi:hypothetical protein
MTAYLYLFLVASLALARPFSFTMFGLVVSLTDLIFVAASLSWVADVVHRRSSIHPSSSTRSLGLASASRWRPSTTFRRRASRSTSPTAITCF